MMRENMMKVRVKKYQKVTVMKSEKVREIRKKIRFHVYMQIEKHYILHYVTSAVVVVSLLVNFFE